MRDWKEPKGRGDNTLVHFSSWTTSLCSPDPKETKSSVMKRAKMSRVAEEACCSPIFFQLLSLAVLIRPSAQVQLCQIQLISESVSLKRVLKDVFVLILTWQSRNITGRAQPCLTWNFVADLYIKLLTATLFQTWWHLCVFFLSITVNPFSAQSQQVPLGFQSLLMLQTTQGCLHSNVNTVKIPAAF